MGPGTRLKILHVHMRRRWLLPKWGMGKHRQGSDQPGVFFRDHHLSLHRLRVNLTQEVKRVLKPGGICENMEEGMDAILTCNLS